MNRVLIVGRVTRDLEKKLNSNGTSFVNFNVAVNRRVQAGQEPQADFINCIAWGKTADNMALYLKKGSLISVEGRINTRNYEKDGHRVYITEVAAERVNFLSSKNSNNNDEEKGYFADESSYSTFEERKEQKYIDTSNWQTADDEEFPF